MTHEFATSAWTADGAALMTGTPRGSLIQVRVDGALVSPIQLHRPAAFAFSPTISPDGSRIAFSLADDGPAHLYTAKPRWHGPAPGHGKRRP